MPVTTFALDVLQRIEADASKFLCRFIAKVTRDGCASACNLRNRLGYRRQNC